MLFCSVEIESIAVTMTATIETDMPAELPIVIIDIIDEARFENARAWRRRILSPASRVPHSYFAPWNGGEIRTRTIHESHHYRR